jgi:hypothetical protein
MEMVGDGGLVDLRERAFLRAYAGREVTQVIDGQRHVGGERLANWLAIVDGLGKREVREVLFHAISDGQQLGGAFGGRGLAPRGLGGMGGIERLVDVLGGGTRHLADHLTTDGRGVLEILALDRRQPLAADVVVVAAADLDVLAGRGQRAQGIEIDFLIHFDLRG